MKPAAEGDDPLAALPASADLLVAGEARPTVRVSLPVKLAYGFGSIAYGVKDNGFSSFLLLFYNQVIGLPAQLVGVAIMVALILDAFIDPLIGHYSDHTQSRWGRRHPFMYAAAVPVGLLYLLLWHPPHASQGVILLFLIATAILVRTCISAYEVPSSALAPELTEDYHERTAVLGYRYLFGWVGGMGMALATYVLFLKPDAAHPVGQLNPAGYHTYAIVAAVVMTGAILISAAGTQRQVQRLRAYPIAPTTLRHTFRSILGSFRNKGFAVLLVAGIFSFTNQGLNFALSTYFSTFLWGLPAAALGAFTLSVLLGVGLSLSFANVASRWIGKRDAAVWCTLVYILIATSPYVMRLLGWFPPNGSPILLPLLLVVSLLATGLGVSGAILGASMMSDVVEDAQVRTGERTEGLFFAGSFFMQKCVSGLGLFLSGAILALAHFPAQAVPGHVPPGVMDRLVLLYVAVTLVCGVIATLVLSRFPLSQADHKANLAELAVTLSNAAPLPGGEPEPTEGMKTGP